MPLRTNWQHTEPLVPVYFYLGRWWPDPQPSLILKRMASESSFRRQTQGKPQVQTIYLLKFLKTSANTNWDGNFFFNCALNQTVNTIPTPVRWTSIHKIQNYLKEIKTVHEQNILKFDQWQVMLSTHIAKAFREYNTSENHSVKNYKTSYIGWGPCTMDPKFKIGSVVCT